MKYSLWYLGKMGEHQHNDRVEGSHMVFQESNLPLTECRSPLQKITILDW